MRSAHNASKDGLYKGFRRLEGPLHAPKSQLTYTGKQGYPVGMGSRPDTFDITELAQQAGVSARTIRYYGELNLLKATSRGPGGRRQYGADAAERLRFISRLKALGLTLEEIGELNRSFDVGATPAMLERLDELLAARQSEVATRIHELRGLEQDLQDYRDRIRNKPRNGKTKS